MIKNHTFAICAYKESEYLEECIKSVKNQTSKSNIIITTSTPNEFVYDLGKKHNLQVFVNTGQSGIVGDWNFAYKTAKTEYVTIAHQDDIYERHYLKNAMMMLEQASRPLIFFSDYFEIREGKTERENKLLKVKRLMLKPLKGRYFQKSKFIRRRILSFGCPICCPSVTFYKPNLPKVVFAEGFRSDEDWEAWERLSKLKGEFVYCPKQLMGHRIHEESETSIIIGDNLRRQEDYAMFSKFWPSPIAKLLVNLYSSSEESNKLG